MSEFSAADHVTEREPGPWRDCTFASMLETLRLGLPNGRSIPATEEEKERFRAAAGLPDNHTGATIEDTLPAAERLYGLEPEQYLLTTEWEVLRNALSSSTKIAVVQGMMSAVPSYLRRWSPSFGGAHAVAARGDSISPDWCDPLAPKGSYKGEPVAWATWRSFFTALPGARALIMEWRDEALIAIDPAVKKAALRTVRVTTKTPLLRSAGGQRVADAQVGYRYQLIGSEAPGYRAIVVDTRLVWDDGVIRPTLLYIASRDTTVEAAPPAGDVKHTVTVEVDGQPVHEQEV